MKLLFTLFCFSMVLQVSAQYNCASFEYQQTNDAGVLAARTDIENFIKTHTFSSFTTRGEETTIKIPVVVHIIYHYPGENVADAVVYNQIQVLNRDFRKQNSDTTRIPGYFQPLAADCQIEFVLARVDPRGRATTGIIHKYSPVTQWNPDDKIKLSSEMGDDGWDSKSYLNIWVGTLTRSLGYSSFPGDPAYKDGIVINNTAFGNRIAVHEAGHWLGLRHLWGDADCGDDGVDDTPKQQTFTNGCPTAIRISCNNGPYGDLYVDYMDFTSDNCTVMFTSGQKSRMRSLFSTGGARISILLSKALGLPSIEEIPLPDSPPRWLHVQIYPNPTKDLLTINLEYDVRWIGKKLSIFNTNGQLVIQKIISSKIEKIDVSGLPPAIYFIKAEKDGEKLLQKFARL